MRYVSVVLTAVAVVAMIGLGIGSIDLMPSYAVVFLDDTNKTFVALPCIDEWRSRPSQTIDLVRRGTAGEAAKLGYKPDAKCREAVGYSEDGRSLTGLALVWLGVLPPLVHWWDKPYRTEDGTVVYPGARRPLMPW
jgi:hypothetical protein